MKMSNYATKYLNAADIAEPTIITISNVQEEKVGGEDGTPVMYVEELDQAIVLGKTQITQLIELLGTDDSEDWIGRKVVVWNDRSVMFGGKRVGGVRFRPQPGEQTPASPTRRKGGKNSDVEFPGA